MRVFNILNIDYGKERLKEFCINNYNAVSASIKSIISVVRANSDKLATISDGEYDPLVVNNVNATTITTYVCGWSRSGNSVTVYGRVSFACTAVPLNTAIDIPLPVEAKIASVEQCSGTACAVNTAASQNPCAIYGNVTANAATLQLYSLVAAATDYHFIFGYKIK